MLSWDTKAQFLFASFLFLFVHFHIFTLHQKSISSLLFISLFPRTVTLFQICYYPFFTRIYNSVDSLFLVLFVNTRRTRKTEYRKTDQSEYIELQNYRTYRITELQNTEARTGIILFTIVSLSSTCSLVLTFLSVYPFPTTTYESGSNLVR